jgi:hypothetical protein
MVWILATTAQPMQEWAQAPLFLSFGCIEGRCLYGSQLGRTAIPETLMYLGVTPRVYP